VVLRWFESRRKGFITIADDRGRILAESHSSPDGFSSITANIPLRGRDTLYNRWGDWFAWATMVAFAAGWATASRNISRAKALMTFLLVPRKSVTDDVQPISAFTQRFASPE
jgi:apolipoprotein N-acyltransferase